MKRNLFWASTVDTLNDDNELKFDDHLLKQQLDALQALFHIRDSVGLVQESLKRVYESCKTCGIFSLSSSPLICTMWSHYADSKGYCLEFDSDELLKVVNNVIKEQRFFLQVSYVKEIPQLTIDDMDNMKRLQTKLLATKGEEWSSEEEVRLVTDKPGEQPYISSALTGVIFGYNTSDEVVNKICKTLSNRNLNVWKVCCKVNSYEHRLVRMNTISKGVKLVPSSYEFCNAYAPVVDNFFDLYGWISLMSQLIIINRALYVNKQQEGKICAIT